MLKQNVECLYSALCIVPETKRHLGRIPQKYHTDGEGYNSAKII